MGREKRRLADQTAIKSLFDATNVVLDPRPLIVYTMRKCGCTYQEIADVFGVKRQMIEQIVKLVDKDIYAHESRGTENPKKIRAAKKGSAQTSK